MTGQARGRQSLTALVAARLIDAEAAGLLWLLIGSGMPWLVSGRPADHAAGLASALERISRAARSGAPSEARSPRRSAALLEEESLADVLAHLAAPPLGLTEDQLRNLGLVLVVSDVPGLGARLVTAHYLRPVERDRAGHLQRRPPALLAAHDAARDAFEHFAWAISDELADRLGLSLADFERELARRRALLAELAAGGRLTEADLAAVVGEFRATRPD